MRFHSFVHNLREYFVCLRINSWLHNLGLAILGIAFYSPASLFTLKSLQGIIISALYLAHGFSLNNYFDTTLDQHLQKMYLPPGRVSYKKFLAFSYSLLLLNCWLGYIFSPGTLSLIILGSILVLFYSAPPWRFKKNIALNIILNSAGFAIIFLIGFISVGGQITPAALMLTALFAIIFVPLQIVHQIAHAEADRLENIQTVFHRYGLKPTIGLSYGSLLLLLFWSLLLSLTYRNYRAIFFLTALFCLLISLTLKRISTSKEPPPQIAAMMRIFIRKICISYGIMLVVIFYFAG